MTRARTVAVVGRTVKIESELADKIREIASRPTEGRSFRGQVHVMLRAAMSAYYAERGIKK